MEDVDWSSRVGKDGASNTQQEWQPRASGRINVIAAVLLQFHTECRQLVESHMQDRPQSHDFIEDEATSARDGEMQTYYENA